MLTLIGESYHFLLTEQYSINETLNNDNNPVFR
jgi:hypothetical protein